MSEPHVSTNVTVEPPQPTPPHSREGSGSTPPPQWGRLGGGAQLSTNTSTTDSALSLVERLLLVRARIAQAAIRVGRDPSEITLVAVSKTKPFGMIAELAAGGQVDFGENRLEELWEKVAEAEQQAVTGLRWHAIGTIQSRKSKLAVGPFALVHSVDTPKLAARLSRDATAAGETVHALLEVNVSGEESKHGFTPQELLAQLPDLLALPGLRLEGLMTMAPLESEAEATRPIFQRLRQLGDEIRQRFPQAEFRHLSMGMTNDFEVAIEEGSTIVRVGTAIFGKRENG
ncbi:MAG: YggS family pyridoxal phosphate-dependent enzyme [Caldilineaceae bacterium]|nr:YggS family pyridoxal phosphate-dependent enzyme [Caldilineaceae bacterium]